MKTFPIISKLSSMVEKDFDKILDNFELTICIICGREVESFWEPHYKGIRASCDNCEINWAES